MAKKKDKEESTITNYYDLKVDKVDELVEILKTGKSTDSETSYKIDECTGEDTPDTKTKKGKSKEFDPYKIDKLSRIPAWVKAFFIKFWFFGAVCYFVNMGLGVYVGDALDILVIDGVLTGIVVDMLVNPIFRMLESDSKEYNYYIMFPFPFKAYWTFIANILYYVLVFIGVSFIYAFINGVAKLGIYIEPILFGVFTLIVDMALIGVKDLIVYLVKKHKQNKEYE